MWTLIIITIITASTSNGGRSINVESVPGFNELAACQVASRVVARQVEELKHNRISIRMACVKDTL